MIKNVNPFDNQKHPNHLLNPLSEKHKIEAQEIYDSFKLIIAGDDPKEIKSSIHAMVGIVNDALAMWRDMGIADAEDKGEGFIDDRQKQDSIDTICYCQYTQVITLLLHILPTDINKKVLETCIEAQKTREQHYFGQDGEIMI